MSFAKKIDSGRLLVMILSSLLALYILYSVWSKMLPDSPAAKILEGFEYKNPVKISSSKSNQTQMPIVEYCIKAAYNSAFDGSKITIEALDNVLKRGCRFLDFEIFYVSEIPVVGVCIDPDYKSLLSSNTMPFSKIMTHIYNTAFIASSIPNPRDPLFVNLRIKANCDIEKTKNCAIYSQIASIMNKDKLHYTFTNGKAVPVTGNTTLTSIMGCIVICLDTTLCPEYANHSPELEKIVNIETNNTNWAVYNYSDFTTMTQNILSPVADYPMMAEPQSGSLKLKMAVPDMNKKNVNNPASPASWIRNFGCQTIFYQFWKPPGDAEGNQYEEIFDKYKTAFVPIGFVVSLYDSNK